MAILTDEASRNLSKGVDALVDSIEREEDQTEIKTILASAYVLCGLRYQQDTINNAFRRLNMLLEESTTYQGILEEGKARGLSQGLSQGMSQGLTQGLRNTIIRIGSKRFGPPTESMLRTLHGIDDVTRLEILADRILDAGSWDDLVAGGSFHG